MSILEVTLLQANNSRLQRIMELFAFKRTLQDHSLQHLCQAEGPLVTLNLKEVLGSSQSSKFTINFLRISFYFNSNDQIDVFWFSLLLLLFQNIRNYTVLCSSFRRLAAD